MPPHPRSRPRLRPPRPAPPRFPPPRWCDARGYLGSTTSNPSPPAARPSATPIGWRRARSGGRDQSGGARGAWPMRRCRWPERRGSARPLAADGGEGGSLPLPRCVGAARGPHACPFPAPRVSGRRGRRPRGRIQCSAAPMRPHAWNRESAAGLRGPVPIGHTDAGGWVAEPNRRWGHRLNPPCAPFGRSSTQCRSALWLLCPALQEVLLFGPRERRTSNCCSPRCRCLCGLWAHNQRRPGSCVHTRRPGCCVRNLSTAGEFLKQTKGQ